MVFFGAKARDHNLSQYFRLLLERPANLTPTSRRRYGDVERLWLKKFTLSYVNSVALNSAETIYCRAVANAKTVMADYQLTATDAVIRTADNAAIPNDPANRDWIEYQQWIADGGVPNPYVPPEPVPPMPAPETTVLYRSRKPPTGDRGQTATRRLGKSLQSASG